MKDLKIFAEQIDEKSRRQIDALMEQPAFSDCKVRIMPDVHAGKGCVIGFTADLGEKVIPNIVGVDIGCGMLCTCLGKLQADLAELDDTIRRNVPSGFAVNRNELDAFNELEAMHCKALLSKPDYLRRSLGSLGGGNHFIELDRDEEGNMYLIIHTGSRNLGKQVADLYQKEAVVTLHGNTRYLEFVKALIAEYRAADRRTEIQAAIDAIEPPASIPAALCYLEGEARMRYLHDMKICQMFANRNRELIARTIVERMGWEVQDQFHTIHNYIDHESNIVRKGAISAKKNERLLIPLNMRDGCILGTGLGNEDWNQSAPHGAGRVMSRTAALEHLTMEDFRGSMQGIYTSSVCPETLDEAPMAYKSMEDILNHIGDSVETRCILKPVYNFKAAESHRRIQRRQQQNLPQ